MLKITSVQKTCFFFSAEDKISMADPASSNTEVILLSLQTVCLIYPLRRVLVLAAPLWVTLQGALVLREMGKRKQLTMTFKTVFTKNVCLAPDNFKFLLVSTLWSNVFSTCTFGKYLRPTCQIRVVANWDRFKLQLRTLISLIFANLVLIQRSSITCFLGLVIGYCCEHASSNECMKS